MWVISENSVNLLWRQSERQRDKRLFKDSLFSFMSQSWDISSRQTSVICISFNTEQSTTTTAASFMCSYSRACSTISGGAEKIFTGVRLVTFCSRASCCMARMICWECLTPTFTAWQKSCCSTFSADASSITSRNNELHYQKATQNADCSFGGHSVTRTSKVAQCLSEMNSVI